MISDGTSTAKVSGVNETSGYITINTIHKIDATATSAQISPIPGEATSVSVNNLPDVDIRIGDVINAFADDGTESLVGIITEIQTGVSITVETISNYSYPNTTLDPTPGNTTPIRVADLVGAPDSVFAGQVVSDFNGTVGIIETDAPSTTYCDVKTMDLGESDNIDFERFTSTTTNLYLPGAQFNSTLGV
ncbi:hypothetical protein FACS1894166_11950 [Bacilli bacterium]|nr:hypothetical protein FACS1894166_11950 [Bacilli bacterium]